MSCEEIQQHLDQAILARRSPDAADRSHVEGCASCGAHRSFLLALAADLEAQRVPAPQPAVLAAGRRRAVQALRERREMQGFLRELVRPLALGLLALPVALVHGFLVARLASALLAGWLPGPLLGFLGVLYFGSLALALGVLYGSIPVAVTLARRARLEPA